MKIVFCLPGRQYSNNFLVSWTMVLVNCIKNGHEVIISQNYSSVVHFARALCLGGDVLAGITQKPFQGKLDYDLIFWIDSDMVFSDIEFNKILESPHQITSGLYRMANATHFAVVKEWDTEYFKENGSFKFLSVEDMKKYKENKEAPRYMEVDYAGMGWMAIKKGVIENIKYPWFYRPAYKMDKDGVIISDMLSEDVSFCKNLQESGFQIMIDTEVIVGHEKSIVL